jgi:hypothetical protein
MQTEAAMWRAMFIAIGVTACILGIECLLIDKAVLVERGEATPAASSFATTAAAAAKRELIPPEWAPWSLLSAGAVVMLYSFTLPKKFSG